VYNSGRLPENPLPDPDSYMREILTDLMAVMQGTADFTAVVKA
jgi:hypothetical protein